MSLFNAIITDLRQKRLLPVAAVLIAGLAAVPVLLAKPAGKVHLATLPPALQGGSAPNAGLPAVNVISTENKSVLKGRSRDPFTQPKGSGTTTGTNTTATTTNTPSSGSGTGGGTTTTPGSGTTTTPSSSTSTTPGTSTPPPPPITHPNPPPAPPGLTPEESYRVAISITNSSGGVGTIDPLQRLSVLPDASRPRLVELGVLKGGSRVLFVVRPGTVVHGPGVCTPGPIDCSVLSLAENQIESVSQRTVDGLVPLAQFAVTTIKADRHATPAAAQKARSQVSSLGQRLLRGSSFGALGLFQYRPALGAVVDLRDLKVGGL
jgi:hypothetical protein